jgi:hypothetical protein
MSMTFFYISERTGPNAKHRIPHTRNGADIEEFYVD